jgi:hypothetical protein
MLEVSDQLQTQPLYDLHRLLLYERAGPDLMTKRKALLFVRIERETPSLYTVNYQLSDEEE